MTDQDAVKTAVEPDELEERQRRETMRALEPYGLRLVSDLAQMTRAESAKWFIWNLHENLDQLRKLEPTLVGRVVNSQLTVCDGQSLRSARRGLEKRIEFRCDWRMLLKYPAYQNEQAYSLGEGWIDLFIGPQPPPHPALSPEQKGYLHADSPLYPNQLFMYGWIEPGAWEEIKPQLHHPHADCQTDIFLRDDFLFPVRRGFDFVTGPAGAVGITNIEIRISSHVRPNTWVKNK